MDYYLAVVEGPEAEDGFSLFFPDLPGCTSGGRTIAEAAANAEEALAFHVAGMREDGDEVPRPSENPNIDADTDIVSLIRVPLFDSGPVKQVAISMPEGVLRQIDQNARERGLNRSAFLTTAGRFVAVGSGRTLFEDAPYSVTFENFAFRVLRTVDGTKSETGSSDTFEGAMDVLKSQRAMHS